MNLHQDKSWEEEFRDYFDKTLKPKKPTMKNLDRELIVDFIKNISASTLSTYKSELKGKLEKRKILERSVAPASEVERIDERAFCAGVDAAINLIDK